MSLSSELRRRAVLFVEEPLVRIRMTGRLLAPFWRWRFHHFGARSVVQWPELLRGAHKISIGEDVLIMPSWLAVEREAWGRPGPALTIGNRVGIRPHCTITAAQSVVIEDDVGISAHCMVSDSRHRLDGPFDQIGLNPLDPKPTRIGRGTGIAERVAVLRGATIGKYCVIGANSVVKGEIPDYSIAVGAPARVVGSTREFIDARRRTASA